MAGSNDIWNDINVAVAQHGRVRVALSPGARIHRVKRANGRPKIIGATRYGHYRGYNPARGGRPTCAVCKRRLKRDQRLACSPEHEQIAIELATWQLRQVGKRIV